jgi:hypothetical protein
MMDIDRLYGSVELLLRCHGTNGQTTLADRSAAPKMTALMGGAHLTDAVIKSGPTAVRLDGDADYVGINGMPTLQSQDFCIEGWFNFDANQLTNYPCICASRAGFSAWGPGAFQLFLTRPGMDVISFWVYGYGGSPLLQGKTQIRGSGWRHIAVSRRGVEFSLFVDGFLEERRSYSGPLGIEAGQPFFVGGEGLTGSMYLSGYVDQFRVTVGNSRYTDNFQPEILFPVSGATGRLGGVVTKNNTPLGGAVVRAYSRADGQLVGSVISAADGAYAIDGLIGGDVYDVMAIDPADEYNNAVSARVTAVML